MSPDTCTVSPRRSTVTSLWNVYITKPKLFEVAIGSVAAVFLHIHLKGLT